MTPRDDDDKRADKRRGQSDRPDEHDSNGSADLGADWLLSQLDDTGAYSTIDDEPAPPSAEGESRWTRRRFRRRQEREESTDAGAPTSAPGTPPAETTPEPAPEQPLDDDAPTRAFDALADKPVVPPRRTDGVFAWGLTPNDAVDPLVAGRETDEQSPEASEPVAADADPTADAGEPTQAFDPFADHEFEPVSPEQAAVDNAFAKPGAYERLYGEATLSELDAADDDDAGDEATADDVPAPRSAVAAEPVDNEPVLTPEPIDDAGVLDDEPLPDDDTSDQDAVDDNAPPAPSPDAEPSGAPDLGILDLFGGRIGETSGTNAETPPTTPEPAFVSGQRSGDAPSSAADAETRERLRALFESSETAPAQTPAAQTPTAQTPTARAAAGPTRAEPSVSRGASTAATKGARFAGSGSRAGSRSTRPLVLVGIAVAAIVVLGGLFWVGTLIPGMVSASQPEATESSTPTPTPSIPAEGTLPAGTYAWDQLRGGECLSEYESPWAEEFTVVDCEAEHDAQLVAVGTMSDDEGAKFPGEDELASQIYLLCSDPGVIDLAKAGEYGDVQVQGSYPVTEEQWNSGQRNYYCFVDRASGDPLTGSLVPAE